jgi:hypothetical protein
MTKMAQAQPSKLVIPTGGEVDGKAWQPGLTVTAWAMAI